jgi:hypothetical protein
MPPEVRKEQNQPERLVDVSAAVFNHCRPHRVKPSISGIAADCIEIRSPHVLQVPLSAHAFD